MNIKKKKMLLYLISNLLYASRKYNLKHSFNKSGIPYILLNAIRRLIPSEKKFEWAYNGAFIFLFSSVLFVFLQLLPQSKLFTNIIISFYLKNKQQLYLYDLVFDCCSCNNSMGSTNWFWLIWNRDLVCFIY